MESEREHYGEVLRRRRLKAGYSQKMLAHKAGLPDRVIGGIERGEREPSDLHLVKIAQGLGTDVSELLPEIFLVHLERVRALEREMRQRDGGALQLPLTLPSMEDLRKKLEALVPDVIDTILTTVLVLRSAPAAQALFSAVAEEASSGLREKPVKARARASRRKPPH